MAKRPTSSKTKKVTGAKKAKPSKRSPAKTQSSGAAKPPGKPSWLRRIFVFCLKWSLVAAIWGMIAVGGILAWYAAGLPDVDEALAATRKPTVTLVAADGSTLATVGDVYGVTVRLKDLPPAMPHAVVATEDRRFYDHFGLDVIGLTRAFYVNFRAGHIVQGGSTVTQQVAKNLFLTPERSYKRKIQEVLLALWLEHRLSKDQILTVYLNRVYLGAGTYGVDAASRKFFGHPARDLSTYEAAMLAGLLKAPSRYNPRANPELADERARIVLHNMVRAGYLSEAEARAAEAERGKRFARGGRGTRYFVDWVMDQVWGFVSPGNRDLVVKTTLDPTLQDRAEEAITKALAGPGRKQGVSQAALVSLSPRGAVRVMVGGRDYARSQFNRAAQALRQPGSAFKPFVYLAGLEAGLTPDTVLSDSPVTIDGWSPRNFTGRYKGDMTMRQALAESINTVAVRVAAKAGYKRVVDTAKRLGLTADLDPNPSIALGTGEVTPLELTAAYAVFANGGRGVWPYGIEEIQDGDGQVLYRRSGSGPGRVVGKKHIAAMNRMLAGVVDGGTGKAAALAGRPVAGKTGTSQNYRDAWFVGYTADLVTGLWMGNDNGSPTRKVTGGGLPAQTWADYMARAHAGVAAHALPETQRPEPPKPAAQEEGGFWQRLKDVLGGGEG